VADEKETEGELLDTAHSTCTLEKVPKLIENVVENVEDQKGEIDQGERKQESFSPHGAST
jgi:hypothetical protein